ncbi:MAG: DUF4148 domain-containing protein [Acidovorax sp.]
MQVFRTVTTAALIAVAGFGSIAQAQTAQTQPLTRAEVKAQVAQAMKDGTLFRGGAIYQPIVADNLVMAANRSAQAAQPAAPVVAQGQAAQGSATAE